MDRLKYTELELTKSQFASILRQGELVCYDASFFVLAVFLYHKVSGISRVLSDFVLVWPLLLLFWSKKFKRIFLCYGWARYALKLNVDMFKKNNMVCIRLS
ncbi:hypothetical protein C8D97_102240 [Pleionea mediterranea]|uniref:Uncharacterized protein n=1 Tax=Pleionea mediterranea TaxID=523701 RepID=A0A316G223_9GAMM|nr:hypothetical protein C8D97_102240 [Pleionea mediterranea]